MKSQYADPNPKNSLVTDADEIIENDELAEDNDDAGYSEDEVEYINPEDLDAVDPDDIKLGEEYL